MNPPKRKLSSKTYIDMRQFIQVPGIEGQSHNVGKVPSNTVKKNGVDIEVPIGKSGVTIGVGFDLGQHNEQQLVDMGFTNRMIEKFRPYLGKTGSEAISFLKNNELVLNAHPSNNQDYVAAIEKPIMYYSDKLASKYDEATGVPGDFASLDPAIQGTIFSVLYQYGMEEPSVKTPKFWKHATSKNWGGLLNELETGQWGTEKSYYNRRKLEAKKLRDSGAVVTQSVFDQDGPNIGGIHN